MKTTVWLICPVILFVSLNATAKINVVTTTPDIAWAVKEIGKDNVEVKSLLKGTEDPHFADAVPEFIRLVANAEAVFSVGLELETGWLPKVLTRSGNAKVQPSGKGYCELGTAVEVLEKPSGQINRSMGDVHPSGNPHFWLSPKALGQGTKEIVATLTRIDPEHKAAFESNSALLLQRLDELVKRSKLKLEPLLKESKERPVLLEYHKEFAYFIDLYSLRSYGSLEEKPGVPPSAGRIAESASGAKAAQVKFILATDYNPRKTIERAGEISGVPILIVPASVQPNGTFKDYIELHDHIVDSIAKLLK